MHVDHLHVKTAFSDGWIEEAIYKEEPPLFEKPRRIVTHVRTSKECLWEEASSKSVEGEIESDIHQGRICTRQSRSLLVPKHQSNSCTYILIYFDGLILNYEDQEDLIKVVHPLNQEVEW